MRRRGVDVVVSSTPPSGVDAVVAEEDSYLVLSADPEVREPEGARLRAFHEAYSAEPAEPGTVVVQGGSALRLLAVVHDLSQDPSWREEWIAAALQAVLREADSRRVRILAMPPLGRVHGSLPSERFVSLLRSALHMGAPRHLERIWVVAPEEDAGELRSLLESRLWR